jgi:hypothetical protein
MFRQRYNGDWRGVIAEVRDELRRARGRVPSILSVSWIGDFMVLAEGIEPPT